MRDALDTLISEEDRLGKYLNTDRKWDNSWEREKEIYNNEVVGALEEFRPDPKSFIISTRNLTGEKKDAAESHNAKIRADMLRVRGYQEAYVTMSEAAKGVESGTLQCAKFYKALGKGEFDLASHPDDEGRGKGKGFDFFGYHQYKDAKGAIHRICYGVDVTVNSSVSNIEDKIFATADDLEKGIMPEADYVEFKNLPDSPRGRVRMPRVTMGVPSDEIINATETKGLLVDYFDLLRHPKDKEKERVIEDNPIFRKFINQVINQLVFYTEKAALGYLRVNDRKFSSLPDESKELFNSLGAALKEIETMEIRQERESPEFQRFIKLIEDNEEKLYQIDLVTAENIFMHLELLKHMQDADKEKSSRGISLPGAQTEMERFLNLEEGKKPTHSSQRN